MKLKFVRPASEVHTREFYDAHANKQIAAIHAMAAEFMFGPGKIASDLSEHVRSVLVQQFAAWVSDDQERMRRYDALETTLTSEFWSDFRAEWFDPVLERFGAMETTR